MRYLIVGCALLVACAKQEPPVQDPLDYLQVGVEPREEATALIDDLRRNGFQVARRIEGQSYVAFDAASGGEALVRVVTSRGVALSLETPDVRWPERLWVELAPDPRPDFNGDGQRDVVVALRERDRTCLAWAEVTRDGFVAEVFRPRVEWGDEPCPIEIDPNWPKLVLEVSVPGHPGARVRVPMKANGRAWAVDESPAAKPDWEREIKQRQQALEVREMQGDTSAVARLRAELDWLEQLRNAPEPVLEPADDGEEAR